MAKKEVPLEDILEVDWYKLIGILGGLIFGIVVTVIILIKNGLFN